VAPDISEYFPFAHFLQSFFKAAPIKLLYVPTEQLLHALFSMLLLTSLYLPSGQFEHAFGVPGSAENLPATHSTHTELLAALGMLFPCFPFSHALQKL
jgi:hypothetical protein|tara:strand:- start:274 stop:567 length:294 start_codon:yes stop_codon:yes gene_type:complete